MKKAKEAKVQKLPDGIKVVGFFKMKDKEKRDIISFPVGKEVEGIIIQKVKGESNKIIVAVKLYDWAVKMEQQEKKMATKAPEIVKPGLGDPKTEGETNNEEVKP